MAERNEFRGLLGCHDTGHACNTEHVTLGDLLVQDKPERFRSQNDSSRSHSLTDGFLFFRDVNHARRSLLIEMGELRHRRSFLQPPIPDIVLW